MKVEIQNRDLRVRWQYDLPDGHGYNKVLCFIESKPSDGLEPIQQFASIKRYFKDVHNKEVARRSSLKKVLREHGYEKADRKVFWEAYLQRNQLVKV